MLWYILSGSWNLGIRLVVFVTGSVLGSQPDMVLGVSLTWSGSQPNVVLGVSLMWSGN